LKQAVFEVSNKTINYKVVQATLTPKVLEAIFKAFLKVGQAIVDSMFVQKNSNF
jgi:hypothetical protein